MSMHSSGFQCGVVILFLCHCTVGAVAVKRGHFGEGNSRSIHLDNVLCRGDEERILNCGSNAVGVNNCDHFEDAGVICDCEFKHCRHFYFVVYMATICKP